MTIQIAAGAQNIANHFRDQITVKPVTGYNKDGGSPIFGTSRTVTCRVTPKQSRQMNEYGDLILNTGYSVLVPATDPITAYDYVELPEYGVGPVVAQVSYHKDVWGALLYKEITIA